MTPRSLRWSLVAALAASGAACGEATAPPRDVPALDVPAAAGLEASAELRRAERLIAAGADEDAEPVLRGVVELAPERAEAWVLLGSILVDAERHADAVPVLERAVALDSADLRSLGRLAQCHHVLGDLEAAEAAYRGWAERDDRTEEALFGLGQVLYLRGEIEDAVQALRQAERRRGGRADIRSELGLALQAAGKLEEAEAKQRDAIERDPAYATAWFRLGNVIAERDADRLDDAVRAMEQATIVAPRMTLAHLYLYRLLKLVERDAGSAPTEASEDRWRTILRLHGRRQLVRFGLGERAGLGGKQAERRLRRLVDGDASDDGNRARLARLLHAEGRLDEALEQYAVLLDDPAVAAGVVADAAAARLAHGDLAGSLELFAAAVAREPALPGAMRLRGWALLRADRVDDAEAALAVALEVRPDDRLAALAQGLVWMRDGRLDAGLHAIARAGWLE